MPELAFALRPAVSRKAQEDIDWLSKKLGQRFEGHVKEDPAPANLYSGEWKVTLRRLDGRGSYFFGRSLEQALERARAAVEGTLVNRRVAAL